MGFNFGAFIGGASENLVSMIKQKEAELYQEEQDEKERLRQARVEATKQRREDEKAAQAAAQRLKLAGFDKDRIAYALGQGTTYSEGLAEYGAIAIANNKDPNTLLKYSSNIDEFKKLSGPPSLTGQARVKAMQLPKGFELPEDVDASKYFEEDRETFTALTKPVSKPVTSLQAVRANKVNEMLKHDPSSPEYAALSEENDFLLKEIKREHETNVENKDTDPFSIADSRNDWKMFLNDAATPLGIESLDGEIINIQAGNQGKAHIAELRAGLMMKDRLTKMNMESGNYTSIADVKIESAMESLKLRGLRIAYSASDLSTATKEVLSSGEEIQRDLGLLEKFKMPFNPQTQEYKSTYSGNEALQLAKQGALDYGDVIVVDNIPVIFTGLKHTYSNLSTEEVTNVNVPWIFLDDREQFQISDTTFYR